MNRKEMLWISVSVFMTVIAWMVLEIYKVSVSSSLEKMNSLSINKTKLSVDIIKILKTKKP